MGTIGDILRLFHEEGLSCRQISKSLSVSASTVSRSLRRAHSAGISWPLPADVDPEALTGFIFPSGDRVPAPDAAVHPDWDRIAVALDRPRAKRRVRMIRKRLWEAYRDDVRSRGGEVLSYSRFCHLLKVHREGGCGETGKMVYEYFPGQVGLSDFSGKRLGLRQKDGSEKDVEIFVAVLCYSRLTYVEAVPDQSARSWRMAHRRAFEYFGGVPTERWSIDNLKAGVIRPGREDWQLNPSFEECMRHYCVPVVPARKGNVQERALVESTVRAVQQRVLLPLQDMPFFSQAAMNRAIGAKLEEFNHCPMSTWRVSRRQRFEDERPFLRGLPAMPCRAQLRVQADVQDVDCREGRGISRTLLTQLATGEWIRNAHHLCIGGKTGVGKTFLICALAHQACMQRLSVLYRRVPDLMAELADTRGTPRHPRLLRRLDRLDLLCLDDWGLNGFSSEERRDVLEIVERRYQRKSLLIGSQIPTELWHPMIGEPILADAILDRIVHNAYHIELDGESKRREVRLPTLDGLAAETTQAPESPARHPPGACGAPEIRNSRAPRAGKQA